MTVQAGIDAEVKSVSHGCDVEVPESGGLFYEFERVLRGEGSRFVIPVTHGAEAVLRGWVLRVTTQRHRSSPTEIIALVNPNRTKEGWNKLSPSMERLVNGMPRLLSFLDDWRVSYSLCVVLDDFGREGRIASVDFTAQAEMARQRFLEAMAPVLPNAEDKLRACLLSRYVGMDILNQDGGAIARFNDTMPRSPDQVMVRHAHRIAERFRLPREAVLMTLADQRGYAHVRNVAPYSAHKAQLLVTRAGGGLYIAPNALSANCWHAFMSDDVVVPVLSIGKETD